MGAQHTPGPWTFYTEPQPNGCPIVGAKGLMVAMLAHSINHDDQRDTAIANAHLIAAAPMLLAVVQELEESASYWSEYDVPLGIVDRLRAAIAAATGA